MTLTMGMLAATSKLSSYTYNGTTNPNLTGSSFTFNSLPIGTADTTRLVVVSVSVRGGGTTSFSSVTLAGNAMTKAVETSSTNDDAAIFYLPLATGTTANIVVTFSSSQNGIAISVYSLYNLTSTTPNATASGTAGSATISASTNDIVIAAAHKRGVNSNTWTGVNNDYGNLLGSTGSWGAFGSKKLVSSISSVTSTLDQIAVAAWR